MHRREPLHRPGNWASTRWAAADDAEKLIRFDTAFHHTVIATTGNEPLTSLLDGPSSRTLRARVWRGLTHASSCSGRTRMRRRSRNSSVPTGPIQRNSCCTVVAVRVVHR